jgi:hypothetical protein
VSRAMPEAAMTPGASTKAAGFMSLSENNHWINWIPRFSGILMWNMMMNQCIQRYPILKHFWSNLLAQTWQIRWRNLPDLSARVHRPVTFVQRWLHQYCTWKFQYNRTKE